MVAADANRRSSGERSGPGRCAGTAAARATGGNDAGSSVRRRREPARHESAQRLRRAHTGAQRRQVALDPALRPSLDEEVAHRRRLDRSGDDRQVAGVGRQLAEQRVLGPTADEVHDLDRDARTGGRRLARPTRTPSARLSRMHRTSASRVVGAAAGRWPRHAASIRPGMSPGGRNVGSFGSMVGPPAARAAAPARRASRSDGSPASAQVRSDSWRSHRPMTLRRNRTRPSTPRSLVKLARRLSSVRIGCLEFDADEPPRPARDVGELVPLGRDADDRRRRVVRADQRHVGGAIEPGRGGDVRPHATERLTGGPELREDGSREPQGVDDVPRPRAARSDRAGRSWTRSSARRRPVRSARRRSGRA